MIGCHGGHDDDCHLLDGVDGETCQGVRHGVCLELADGLQSAGLVLNLHVVECGIHDIEAETEIQVNYIE